MILLAALVFLFFVGGLPGLLGHIFGFIGKIIETLDKAISSVMERGQKNNNE